MTQTGEPIHPNLARLAAAYDQIIDQMDSGQLSFAQARAKIAQLEARDDQGVRWSIDPDTGEFVRKTAFGELEFDSPPRFGVMTADAHAYSSTARDDDPNQRLELYQVPTLTPPTHLAGATQMPTSHKTSGLSDFMDKITNLPTWLKVVMSLVLVTAVAFLVWTVTAPKSTPTPTPTPTATSTHPAKPSTKATPAPTKK